MSEIDTVGRIALNQTLGHGPGEGRPQQAEGIAGRTLAAGDTRQPTRAGLDARRCLAVTDRREGAADIVLLQPRNVALAEQRLQVPLDLPDAVFWRLSAL